jgi:hypothetical protein
VGGQHCVARSRFFIDDSAISQFLAPQQKSLQTGLKTERDLPTASKAKGMDLATKAFRKVDALKTQALLDSNNVASPMRTALSRVTPVG